MYIESNTKRSWVEVDIDQIIKNYNIYKSKLSDSARIMAVVKADAYGHGDVAICRALWQNGVKLFAVSNIDEAKCLRNSGIGGDILILGYTPPEDFEDLFNFNITQTLLGEEYAELVANSGFNIKCQFAIDTGMNRIGLDGSDTEKCAEIIRKYSKKLHLDGFFTHLCVADADDAENIEFTRLQIEKYDRIRELTKDLHFPLVHCMNSAGGIFHGGEELVRLGIVMYGLKPDFSNVLPDGIAPALSWKSVIMMVKKIKAGESVGYGRSFTATKDMWIATIPTGYADGYRRDLSNKGYVLIKGYRAPIVGRVCMDQMMIDISELIACGEVIEMGDEVTLIGKSGKETLTADDMAHMIGTIGYEIVCGISKRVPRKYL